MWFVIRASTSSVWFEIGRCDARSAKTEVTVSQLLNLRRRSSAGLIVNDRQIATAS